MIAALPENTSFGRRRHWERRRQSKNVDPSLVEEEHMVQRAIVIGCPGAGKSTFSRRLRDATGLPLYYLDRIHHKPDRTTVTKQEFDARLGDILRRNQWIIDGNYNRTLEMRLKCCDTVFLLDYPTEVCLSGVASRIGQQREDMPWQETEFDSEFRQFILDFSKESLPRIYRLIEKYRENREILVFKSREESEVYLLDMEKRSGLPLTCAEHG